MICNTTLVIVIVIVLVLVLVIVKVWLVGWNSHASTYIKIGRRAEGAMDYAMAPAKGERAGGSCPDFPSFLGRKRSCRRTSRCRADRSRHHRTPHR